MEWVGPLIMAIGSVTVAAIGIVVGKGTASAQKNVATIERTGPDWDAFMERIERHHENSIGQLNSRIDRLQSKVQRLEDKLAEKDKLIEESRKTGFTGSPCMSFLGFCVSILRMKLRRVFRVRFRRRFVRIGRVMSPTD